MTTTDDRAAHVLREHREHLLDVAYRLLGSVADAEDAVQEAWLRLRRADLDTIAEPRAWLTTVVARIALDMLRSARARRELYVGPWLPEPLVADDADPADRVTLDESVSMAMLVVLESLTPAERTAFVLHDVFGMPFEEVAEAVGRTPAACRKLASRAREHVGARAPRFTARAGEHERVVSAFLAATVGGDLDALVRVLDPDVVWRADGGGLTGAARKEITGAERVARLAIAVAAREPGAEIRPAWVNGALGYVVRSGGTPIGVLAFRVAGGRVAEVDVVVNPEKLRHLDRG